MTQDQREPAAPTYLLIAMDDDGRAHLTKCLGRGAVVDAVQRAVWDNSSLDEDERQESAGITDTLIEDGIFRFEGDPPLHLFALADHAALSSPPSAPADRDGERLAWRDVKAERERQMSVEGWTPEHDDEHSAGELARAAASYALIGLTDATPTEVPTFWPRQWDESWWKPKDNRSNLVRAGALILAEIERLDRLEDDIQENADYLVDGK